MNKIINKLYINNLKFKFTRVELFKMQYRPPFEDGSLLLQASIGGSYMRMARKACL